MSEMFPPLQEQRWLAGADAAAAYIGRTPKAIYALVRRQKIPFTRVDGRLQFDRDALDRWLSAES